MARKIVITSGKGGVGKTTTVANLGCFLAKFNYRVALMDLDIGLNNLDVVMGLENKIVYDIVDVINNRCRARQALIQDATLPSLYVMPSSHINVKITKEQLKSVVDNLDPYFDFILFDCPAGIEEGFHRAVTFSDEAIVVVTPHISSIRDADKVLSILSSYGLAEVNVLVNRVRGDLIVNKEVLSVEDIRCLLKNKVIGAIPEDDNIGTLASFSGNLTGKGDATRAFYLLATNVIDGTHKIFDCTMNYRGIMGSIRRKLKKKV